MATSSRSSPMTAMCANCPFRKEGAIELSEGRIEEIVSKFNDDLSTFSCHKTLKGPRRECMGSIAYRQRTGQSSVNTRLALAVGDLSPRHIAVSQQLLRDDI